MLALRHVRQGLSIIGLLFCVDGMQFGGELLCAIEKDRTMI